MHNTSIVALALCAAVIGAALAGWLPLTARGLFNIEAVFALLWLAALGVGCRIRLAANQQGRTSAWGLVVLPLLLCLGAAALLLWAVTQAFLSDDFFLVFGNPYSPSQFYTAGGEGFYRPVGQWVLWVMRQSIPAMPVAWGAWGFGLNVLVSAMVGVLGARISDASAGGGGDASAGLWAGSLFLALGVHPEAAIWVAGRFDVMATFFVLAGLLASLRWRRERAGLGLAVSLTMMVLAIATKEIAYGYPILLALAFFVRRQPGARDVRAVIWHVAGALAMLLFRFSMFHGFGGYTTGASGAPELLSVTLLHVVKVLFTRLFTALLVPVNWSVWPSWPVLCAILAGVAALTWIVWRVKAPGRLFVFGFGWVVVAAAPGIAQLLIGPDLAKSRLLYLPSVGFCILLGWLASRLDSGLFDRLAQVALCVFLLLSLGHNLAIWRDVGETVSSGCQQAAVIAKGERRPVRFEGLPPSINGVYAFANGFPVCVAHFSGWPEVEIDNVNDNVQADESLHWERWRWNPEGERFERAVGQP